MKRRAFLEALGALVAVPALVGANASYPVTIVIKPFHVKANFVANDCNNMVILSLVDSTTSGRLYPVAWPCSAGYVTEQTGIKVDPSLTYISVYRDNVEGLR